MRIIVMSDSHGSFNRVRKIVEENQETAQTFIHLGDGLEEFEDVHHLYQQLHFVAVKGNNDWGSMEQKTRTLVCGGKNIIISHGDLFNVKYGPSAFIAAAQEAKADVALYGHTHCARADYHDGLYVVNPGSVMDSHVTPCSYLALDITPQGIVPVIKEIKL